MQPHSNQDKDRKKAHKRHERENNVEHSFQVVTINSCWFHAGIPFNVRQIPRSRRKTLNVRNHTKRKRGILPLLALLFGPEKTTVKNKQTLTPAPLVYCYVFKACLRLHEPPHADGTVFIYLPAVPTSAMSLFTGLNFSGSKGQSQSVSKHFSLCSAPSYCHSVPQVKNQHDASLRGQKYEKIDKFYLSYSKNFLFHYFFSLVYEIAIVSLII